MTEGSTRDLVIIGITTLVGFGYLVHTRGFAATWDALKVAFVGILSPRIPVLRLPCRRRYAEGGQIPQPRKRIDLKRLEAIADIPILDIIEAAEWRAQNPDEPEPAVLIELDTDRWEPRPTDTVRPVDRVPAGSRPRPAALIHVPSTRSCDPCYVPVVPDLAYSLKGYTKRPRVKQSPVTYDACEHEDADCLEVMSHQSPTPVKRIVTSCLRCDMAHERGVLRGLVAQVEEMIADVPCDEDGNLQLPEDLYRHYRSLMKNADQAKTLIQELTAALVARDARRIPAQ